MATILMLSIIARENGIAPLYLGCGTSYASAVPIHCFRSRVGISGR